MQPLALFTTPPIPSLFAEEIVGFARSLTARNLSRNTIASYTTDLRQFAAWLAETTVIVRAPADVTRQDVIDYLAYLADLKLSGVTRARKLAALREFFKYLVDSDVLATSPAANVAMPKKEQRQRTYLRPDEYLRLLAVAGGNTRDTCILTLFLLTGIRVSELISLTLADVDLVAKKLTIRESKGNSSRQIDLEKKAVESLKLYLAQRPAVYDAHLFLSYQGSGISLRGVKKLIEKYKRKAGIEKKISCHSLRHTCATIRAEKGMSPYKLQKLLGHKNIRTTNGYLHVDAPDHKVMEATSLW